MAQDERFYTTQSSDYAGKNAVRVILFKSDGSRL